MELRVNSKRFGEISGRRLGAVTDRLDSGYSRLSSGDRNARSGGHASGRGIGASVRARLRGMSAARGNIQHGLSMVKTASSGLGEIGESLGHMRGLALRAATGTLSAEDRALLDADFQAQRQGMDQVAAQTAFNGQRLLDGTAGTTEIQTGVDPGGSVSIDLPDATSANLGDLQSQDLLTSDAASAALANIDNAIEALSAQQGELGAAENRLHQAYSALASRRMSLARADSHISDTDLATEITLLMQERIAQKAAVSVMIQATVEPDRALELLGISQMRRRGR